MEATPTLFLDAKGQPLKFMDAVVGAARLVRLEPSAFSRTSTNASAKRNGQAS